MPLYTAKCNTCDNIQDYVSKIDDRHITPPCNECGNPTNKILTSVMVGAMGVADHAAVTLPGGKTLYGRSDYLKYMRENGVRPSSDLKGEADHQRKQREVKEKKIRKQTVIETVNKVLGA